MGMCFQKHSGKPCRHSCTFLYVSAVAWVFWEALWKVTARTWLLCFINASFIAAPTEIKGKQHDYLAGVSVWFRQGVSFSGSNMLASPALRKRVLSWQNLNQIWNTTSIFSCHFYQEVLSLGVFWFTENVYYFFGESEHSLIWWPQEPFYLQLDGGRREMEPHCKGNCISLSHTFLLCYIMVYKLLTETNKKGSQLLVQGW